KKFKGTRALRVKKDDCKKKIDKILKEKEFNIDELVMALKIEKEQKAEQSYKTGVNKMSYFQNSLTYLNARTFEAYIELYKSGYKLKEQEKEQYDGVNL